MNTQEAIRWLGIYTNGRFDIWMLSGSAKASCRGSRNERAAWRQDSTKQIRCDSSP